MKARVTGTGRQEYLWSTVIISVLLHAVICLLCEEPTSKPTIQQLDNDEGYIAFTECDGVSVSIRTSPFEGRFTLIVHSERNFNPRAISNLAIGYFNAKDIDVMCEDVEEHPTRKMYVKVDSSAQWRLVEVVPIDGQDATVIVPDVK